MPTQLPYAADAEESLAFDELEASTVLRLGYAALIIPLVNRF